VVAVVDGTGRGTVAGVQWLPHEFRGIRAPVEAQHDVLEIARAGEPFDEAHVTVDPDDGETLQRTGHVTTDAGEDGRFKIFVDDAFVFEFDVRECRGAWLSTLDGADYYGLSVDLGWGIVKFSDAYNGL